jgi:peptidoglycan hydrolase-like protein with peptidoglycan-binding domain
MRFNEFKILLEAKEAPIYVVGDSIAVGIKNASGAPGIAVGGKNTKQVLGMVEDLISSNDLKGAIVILSSGASNATYERPNGERQSFEVANVDAQLKALKRAGAKTFLVGTGSKKSQTFKNSLGTYFVNFERERVNDQLAAAASANGATFLGPLENFDQGLNSGKGDGIHPYGGYLSIYQAATKGVTASPAKPDSATGQGGKPTTAKTPLTSITVPTTDKGPDVADMQKVLKALGYGESLGPFGDGGVDGVIGKYTLNTIKTFQKDAGIKPITGMPDEKTVAKLNELLNTKFKGKIAKSTSADVKLAHTSAVAGKASTGSGTFSKEKHLPNVVPAANIKSYLNSKGLDRNQVAGILANIQHESGFDAGILGDGGTSGGLFQHHNERFSNMMAAAGGSNNWQKNWQKQIDFALSEPKGQQYKGMKFKSPEEATAWWTIEFEVPANKFAKADVRSQSASQYA